MLSATTRSKNGVCAVEVRAYQRDRDVEVIVAHLENNVNFCNVHLYTNRTYIGKFDERRT